MNELKLLRAGDVVRTPAEDVHGIANSGRGAARLSRRNGSAAKLLSRLRPDKVGDGQSFSGSPYLSRIGVRDSPILASVLIQDAGWAGGQHGWCDRFPVILVCAWWRRATAGESCRSVAARFRRRRFFGGEVVAASGGDGMVAPGKMGGDSKPTVGPHRGLHRRADGTDAASDAARPEGRTGGGRRQGLARRRIAVPAPRGAVVSKKTLFALSREVKTSPAGIGDGAPGRPALIRTPRLHRRNLDQDGHGAVARAGDQRGKHLRGFAPYGHWRTLTFLGALRCDRLAAPCVLNRPDKNGGCFGAYVERATRPDPAAQATSSSWTIWAAPNPLHVRRTHPRR